jgi:CRISPR system Cascade subunit CasE
MYLSRVTLKPDICSNSQLGKLLQKSTYNTHQILWDLFVQQERDFLYREEVAKEQISNHVGLKGESVYYLLSPRKPKADTPLFRVETKNFKPVFHNGQRLAFRLRANPVITKGKKRHDLVMDEQVVLFRQICSDAGLPVADKKGVLKTCLLHRDHASTVMDWLCSYLSGTQFFADAHPHHAVEYLLNLAVQEAVSRRLAKWLTESESRTGIFTLCEREVDDEFSEQSVTVPHFQWYGYRPHAVRENKTRLAGRTDKPRFLSVELTGELTVKDPERFLAMIHKGIGPAKAFGCGLMLIRRL